MKIILQKIRTLYHILRERIKLKRYRILERLIKENNYKSFIEVGVWDGRTSKHILDKCDMDKVFCIDNYQESNGIEDLRKILNAKMKASKLDEDNRVLLLQESSTEASKKIEDNSVDIIFLDASHQYEDIKRDINLWWPKVKKGGMLVGHDYSIRWFGVIKAVNESFDYIELDSDYVWYVKK